MSSERLHLLHSVFLIKVAVISSNTPVCVCVCFASAGEQGAGVGEPAGSSSLVQPAGSCGGGREDHPGLAGSDRRPGAHQLHQLRGSEADVITQHRAALVH